MKNSIIALLFLVLAFFGWKYFSKESPQSSESVIVEEPQPAEGISVEELNKSTKPSIAPPMPETSTGATTGFVATEDAQPDRFKAFQTQIQKMGECLGISVDALDEGEELNIGTFTAAIQKELGEVVLMEDEWQTTDIRTSNGEVRRLFIRNSSDEAKGGKSLRYFAYRDGKEVDMGLTSEQTSNPTETLIAGLEKDGDLISKSNASTVYFSSGTSIAITEKNGKISSFEIPHNDKTFSCSGADASGMKCGCR